LKYGASPYDDTGMQLIDLKLTPVLSARGLLEFSVDDLPLCNQKTVKLFKFNDLLVKPVS
jgi:hypothetical protein